MSCWCPSRSCCPPLCRCCSSLCVLVVALFAFPALWCWVMSTRDPAFKKTRMCADNCPSNVRKLQKDSLSVALAARCCCCSCSCRCCLLLDMPIAVLPCFLHDKTRRHAVQHGASTAPCKPTDERDGFFAPLIRRVVSCRVVSKPRGTKRPPASPRVFFGPASQALLHTPTTI